jgi:hypothetical protein
MLIGWWREGVSILALQALGRAFQRYDFRQDNSNPSNKFCVWVCTTDPVSRKLPGWYRDHDRSNSQHEITSQGYGLLVHLPTISCMTATWVSPVCQRWLCSFICWPRNGKVKGGPTGRVGFRHKYLFDRYEGFCSTISDRCHFLRRYHDQKLIDHGT